MWLYDSKEQKWMMKVGERLVTGSSHALIGALQTHNKKSRRSKSFWKRKQNPKNEWLKLWNAWQNLLTLQGEERLFGGKCTYAIELWRNLNRTVLGFLVNSITGIPTVNSVFSRMRFFSNPHLPSPAQYWGKVQWPLSGNQLIFIPGREEWVECIDVQTQTRALCVPGTLIREGMSVHITESTGRAAVQLHTMVMQHESYIKIILGLRGM